MKTNHRVAGWMILILLVFISAQGVVYTKHVSRRLYMELQGLQTARDNLEMEWQKLQLEQSTWATHPRVERQARGRLDMQLPLQEQIVVITP